MPDTLNRALSAQSRLKIAEITSEITSLRGQILDCHLELLAIANAQENLIRADRVRDLKDTIFGCRIEIQARLVQIRRMRADRDRHNQSYA